MAVYSSRSSVFYRHYFWHTLGICEGRNINSAADLRDTKKHFQEGLIFFWGGGPREIVVVGEPKFLGRPLNSRGNWKSEGQHVYASPIRLNLSCPPITVKSRLVSGLVCGRLKRFEEATRFDWISKVGPND